MNIVRIIYGTIKYVHTQKKKQEKLDIQGLEQGTGTARNRNCPRKTRAQDTDGDDSEEQDQHVKSDSATTAQDIDEGDDSENQDQHVEQHVNIFLNRIRNMRSESLANKIFQISLGRYERTKHD